MRPTFTPDFVPDQEDQIVNSSPKNIDAASVPASVGRGILAEAVDPFLNLSTKLSHGIESVFGLPIDSYNPSFENNRVIPSFLQLSAADKYNPIATDVGEGIGYLAGPGKVAEGVLKSVSKLSDLYDLANTSKVAKFGKNLISGATQGLAYAPSGDSLQDATIGGIAQSVGGAIADPVVNFAKNIGTALKGSVLRTGIGNQISDIASNTSNALQAAREKTEEKLENLSRTLGLGEASHPIMRTHIMADVEKIKSPIRAMYDKIKDDLSGKTINLESHLGDDAQQIAKELHYTTPLDAEDQGLSDTNGVDLTSVPASKFIDMMKAARDRTAYAQQKMFQRNIGQDERSLWRSQYEKLKPISDKFNKISESEIPDVTRSTLKDADKLWSEKVYPFYDSSIYKAADNGNLLPSNLMERMSGDEPQNKVMRELFLNNPELTRYAVGEKYATFPQKIVERNDYANPFIDAHPVLRQNISDYQEAAENEKNALDQSNKIKELDQKASNPNYQKQLEDLEKDHSDNMVEINNEPNVVARYGKLLAEQNRYNKARASLGKFAGISAATSVPLYLERQKIRDFISGQ